MANMSYCRFENTHRDLKDCRNALEELLEGQAALDTQYELPAAKNLAKECATILQLLADHAGVSVEDLVDSERTITDTIDKANKEAGEQSTEDQDEEEDN